MENNGISLRYLMYLKSIVNISQLCRDTGIPQNTLRTRFLNGSPEFTVDESHRISVALEKYGLIVKVPREYRVGVNPDSK